MKLLIPAIAAFLLIAYIAYVIHGINKRTATGRTIEFGVSPEQMIWNHQNGEDNGVITIEIPTP